MPTTHTADVGHEADHDDIIHPSPVPFLLVHLACFGAIWSGVTAQAVWLAVTLYVVRMFGVTAGFHRYFSHRSYKTSRVMQFLLAALAQSSAQRGALWWAAKHRHHHKHSDLPDDVHSPKHHGFWHAHLGWILDRDLTNQERFVPDLLADRDMRMVHRLFGPLTILTLLGPAVLGGLITWSWAGALTAFFWAGLVRITFLHHVTWSVNSVCHMIGERPFAARDKSANFWPLAILSMGEAWHNLHHADPTQARHGVRPGQIDISARVIWIFERFGWAHDVHWPTPERLAKITKTA